MFLPFAFRIVKQHKPMRVFRSTYKRGKIIPLWGTKSLRKSKGKKRRCKKMKLLYVGDSNWDLFYDEKLSCVMSIAKKAARIKGCKDSVFGKVSYTRRYLQNEIKKDECRESRLTANGFRVLEGKEIQ
jgi:hypothetical protein